MDEMVSMIEGEGAILTLWQIREVFRPVWLCLGAIGEPTRDADAVEGFMKPALAP